MSDHQVGPDWWLASDGRWYPSDQAPAVPPPETWAPPGPPPRQGMSGGAKAGLVIGGVIGALALLIVAIAVLGEESSPTSSGTDSATDGGDGEDGEDDATDPSAGSAADVPDEFAVVDGDGVSIATPEGWTKLAASDVDMSSEEFAAAFPDAPPEMVEQGRNMFGQGAVLVAFDFTDPEFASNVTIISIPGEAPLGLVEDQARDQVEALGGEVIESGTTDIPTGEATRLEYTLDVALPGGSSAPASGVQYYAPFDGRTYVITITSEASPAALAEQIIATFRVL